MRIVLAIVLLLSLSKSEGKSIVTVTHEEIRDVMLMMVRVMGATESKLRRHEMRERVLGDSVRRSLGNLERKLSRLDGKIDKLMEDVSERSRSEDVERVRESIEGLKEAIKNTSIKHTNGIVDEGVIKTTKPLDQLESSEENSEEDAQIADRIQSDLTKIKSTRKESIATIEKIEKQMDTNGRLLQSILDKLDQENGNFEVPSQDAAVEDWHGDIIEALGRQEDHVETTLAHVKSIRNETTEFMETLQTKSSKDLDGLTTRIDTINLIMEDVQEKLSSILDSDLARVNSTQDDLDANTSALAEQKFDANSGKDDRKIVKLLEELGARVDQNGDGFEELLKRVESILSNEEQMLQFSRKSSQDITDAIETLMISMELNCGGLSAK